MPSPIEAGAYLLGFGTGTLAAMVAFATLLGRFAPQTRGSAYRRVFVAASGAALLLGLVWLALAGLGVDVHAHGT